MDPFLSPLQVDTIGGLVAATEIVFTWPTIGFALLGTAIGLVFGALPGLGATVALVLLLPVSFGIDTFAAAVLFGAALGGTSQGGSISAILINTPGTGPNAATILDGYPMARQGRAADALGASASASGIGAIFGLIILLLMLPYLLAMALAFGPAEKFTLAFFGLVVIAIAVRASVIKGLIAGGFGLLLSYVGFDPITGTARFTLGTIYLDDGISTIPALIGVFAVSEILHLALTGEKIADIEASEMSGDVIGGILAPIREPRILIQSSVIGYLVGVVPGIGGTVANFVAYVQAVTTVDDPEEFGNGDVRGVIASEAANDSKDGGALIPTLALGIPGSAAMVVLLGGFVLHGVPPGPTLFIEHIDLVFAIIVALFISNVLTSVAAIVLARPLTRVTRMNPGILVPIVFTLVLVGSFAVNERFLDLVLTLVFGVIGYYMRMYDYSRIALVIALILGKITETNYFVMVQLGGPEMLLSSPISLLLITIMVILLAATYARSARMTQSL